MHGEADSNLSESAESMKRESSEIGPPPVPPKSRARYHSKQNLSLMIPSTRCPSPYAAMRPLPSPRNFSRPTPEVYNEDTDKPLEDTSSIPRSSSLSPEAKRMTPNTVLAPRSLAVIETVGRDRVSQLQSINTVLAASHGMHWERLSSEVTRRLKRMSASPFRKSTSSKKK